MRNVIIVIGATILLINGFVCIYHGLFDSKEIPLLIWIGAALGFVVVARLLVAEIKD